MTADGEPAWGGTTMSIPQRRTLRAVAFAPAVRGFPGGIGDMAADLDDDLMTDEPSGDPEPLADPRPPVAAAPARRGKPPALVPSVWQQSAAVWDEAGLAWQRPAAGEPGPPARAAVNDDPHTEPIPVIPADAAGAPVATVDGAADHVGTAEDAGAAGAANGAVLDSAPAAGAVAGEAPETATAEDPPDAAIAASDPVPGVTPGDGPGDTATTDQASADKGTTDYVIDGEAGPGARGAAVADAGARAIRGTRLRRGRRAPLVAAATCLVLVAGAVAGIAVARSGGRAALPFALVTPYPPATLADTAFPVAGSAPVLPALTGIAADGRTVVAIGSYPGPSASVPLILVSVNGGRIWARATLNSVATGPGAAPMLIARAGGTWLALGQDGGWTSADGRSWRFVPGVRPAAGDTVLGLAGTGTGFVAVGENTGGQPGPVVWTSADGRTWQRASGAALGLTPRNGRVVALRWAASRGGVIVAGGETNGAARASGLWQSTDGGHTWRPVSLPVSNGATGGLAGLAADGAGFVAIRPGRTPSGQRDAVAYESARGSSWRFAGKVSARRHTSLRVTDVAGTSHGFAVAASTRSGSVAFFSARGRGWHQTAYPGGGVAALTTGPGGSVVVAANAPQGPGTRPHLLLTGTGARARRLAVGQAPLAASATTDVSVNGLASAAGTQVAAGTAAGAPALWLASRAGRWTPATITLPESWRDGVLTSVAHGRSGWLAVGQAGPQAAPLPVIVTSRSGTDWSPAHGAPSPLTPGTTLAQAAAGPAGYVVVGSTAAGGAPAPAAWFSRSLSTWARAVQAGTGAPGAVGAMLAVTAAGPGFVAAGSSGGAPAVWTSGNGTVWRLAPLPRPAGSSGAVLTSVAAVGGRVVATGYAAGAAGQASLLAVSADGGRTWHERIQPAPRVPSGVTALTAAGHGFVAAGHAGPAGQVMVWWSKDGLAWRHAPLTAGGLHRGSVAQINALSAGGGTLSRGGGTLGGGGATPGGGEAPGGVGATPGGGGAPGGGGGTPGAGGGTLTGAGDVVGVSGEHPILWSARYR